MTRYAPAARIDLPVWYARIARDQRSGAALVLTDPAAQCDVLRDDARGLVVLFDGYLFDGADAARTLNLQAESGGAAIVAAAFDRSGADLFDMLDGCYLAAVWDARSRRLLLGHDALGRHPAFYAVDAEHVWFAPNVLALARSGDVSTRPNRLSLALGAVGFWPEARETYFAGIRRVHPGHYLEVLPAAVREHKYWEPMPADDEPLLEERVVHEQFEPALNDSVRRCLALQAQGIMLSGGVDSVTIAALAAPQAAALGRGPLIAVSARTGDRLTHEEETQSKVAAALGLPHEISTTPEWLSGQDPLEASIDLVPDLPAPTDVWWVGTYTRFYRRTAAQGLTVLLTGSGGDNWLGVADAHAADLMGALKLGQLYWFLKADMKTGGASLRSSARRLLWAGGLRWHLDSAWARWSPGTKRRYHHRKWAERLPAWLAPDNALREELLDRLLARRPPSLTETGKRPRSYYLHSLRTLSNPFMFHEYETAFHVEASCGLRLLSPYHDRRLVSFFNRIPPRVLVHGDRYKGLLRPVVQRHLPGLGLEDQRKDYPEDLRKRKLNEIRQSMGRLWPPFRFERLDGLGVVDEVALKSSLPDPGQATFPDVSRLFMMMSSERWVCRNAV